MNKNLCEAIAIKKDKSDGENIYCYELIERKGETTADWRLTLFSIRITMTDKIGTSRSFEAKNLFSNKREAVEFFDMIVENLATPIDLPYILEDEDVV